MAPVTLPNIGKRNLCGTPCQSKNRGRQLRYFRHIDKTNDLGLANHLQAKVSEQYAKYMPPAHETIKTKNRVKSFTRRIHAL